MSNDTTNPEYLAAISADPDWSMLVVVDRLGRLWQHKDKWVAVTRDRQGRGAQNVNTATQLVELCGPLSIVLVGVDLARIRREPR